MDLNKYFKLKPPFGWGELIAACGVAAGIVVAVMSVVSRSVTAAVISQDFTHMVDYFSGDPVQHILIFCDTVSVTNTGDKDFSIKGLTARQDKLWKGHFMIGIKSSQPLGRLVVPPFDLLTDQEITPLEPKVFNSPQPCEDFFAGSIPGSLSKAEFGEDKLQRINILVKPGMVAMLNIGAVLDPNIVAKLNQIHFGYEVHLSNGSSYSRILLREAIQ